MYDLINNISMSYSQEIDTDYALLINGVWGSGKTYYVLNNFSKLLGTINKKLIYISLNGCDDINNIKKKIAFQLIMDNIPIKRKINIEWMEHMFEIGKEIQFYNTHIYLNIFKYIQDYCLSKYLNTNNFHDKILVFDDLERISEKIHIKDILGSIYDSYIRKGIKVFFIVDETKIQDNKQFNEIKEKYIRYTILFSPDYKNQINDFIKNKYQNNSSQEYLIKNFDFLIECLTVYQINNLRTISFIFDNFIKILQIVNNNFINKYRETIFKVILAISNSYKKGDITINNLNDNCGLKSFPILRVYSTDDDINKTKSFPELFYDQFYQAFGHDFVFIDSIFNLILTGVIHEQALNNDLKRLFEDNRPEEVKVLTSLQNFRSIKNEDLMIMFPKFINFIEEGKYHLNDILNIYSVLEFYYKKQYIEDFNYNIKKIINMSIEKIKNNPSLIPSKIEYTDHFHLFYDDVKTTEVYKLLQQKIIKIITENDSEIKKSKFIKLFKLLLDEDSNFIRESNESYYSHLFIHFQQYDIYKDFHKLSNKGIRLLESYLYENIIRNSKASQYDYIQIDSMIFIKEYLEKFDNNQDICHFLKMRFKDLVSQFEQAINHIKNTHFSEK